MAETVSVEEIRRKGPELEGKDVVLKGWVYNFASKGSSSSCSCATEAESFSA